MNYDLVTFDIFDTLVHRRLRAPVDVFDAVRLKVFEEAIALFNHDILSRFPTDRIAAETQCRQQRVAAHGGEGEIRFDEIYKTYQELTRCTDELRDVLMSTELAIEQQVLFRSTEGYRQFVELGERARHVAFVSDMYHSPHWLGDVLLQLGFGEHAGDHIFVSGEHRVSKHTGALYQVVRERFGLTDGARWLHVGDNLHSDIAQASRHGAQTVTATWARVDNVYRAQSGIGATQLVHSLHQFLELPQAAPQLPDGEFEQLGYKIFGPLVFGYLVWLFARCQEDRIEKALFVARDGWLPHQLFEEHKGRVGLGQLATQYVYGSRQIGFHIGTKDWDCNLVWMHIGGRVQRTVRRILESMGVDVETNKATVEKAGFSA